MTCRVSVCEIVKKNKKSKGSRQKVKRTPSTVCMIMHTGKPEYNAINGMQGSE